MFISHKYVFQTYGATNFIALYHGVLFDRIQNAVGCLLMLFGYIPDKGFLSLRGVVTMAAFVLLGIYGYVTVKSGKMQRVTGFRSLITLFCTESVCVYFYHQYHGAAVLYHDLHFRPAGIVFLSGRGKNAL